jgi:hypothetical protein
MRLNLGRAAATRLDPLHGTDLEMAHLAHDLRRTACAADLLQLIKHGDDLPATPIAFGGGVHGGRMPGRACCFPCVWAPAI